MLQRDRHGDASLPLSQEHQARNFLFTKTAAGTLSTIDTTTNTTIFTTTTNAITTLLFSTTMRTPTTTAAATVTAEVGTFLI